MSLSATWHATRRAARWAWSIRAWLVGGLVRLLVIGALAVWIQASTNIFQIDQTLDVQSTLDQLGFGLALCALAVFLAAHRRIRWAAIALGGAHGGMAILLMDVAQLLK